MISATAVLGGDTAEAFVTPRRLTLVVDGLAKQSADVADERKGPREGAPDAAIQGFLKAAGLTSIDQATLVEDPKKGNYYVARVTQKGRPAEAIIAGVVTDVIAKFPWPKSMRWGASKLRWVRPLQAIICVFDGRVVPFEIEGIKSGNTTFGHRFLSPAPILVDGFDP